MSETAKALAKLVSDAGGRAYYVGGCVRDRLLNRQSADEDIEVHGVEPAVLLRLLEQLGHPRAVGSAFGVYVLDGCSMDIAMPRREHAIGAGHKDFEVQVDPFIGPEAAARRRDFTVNAMMEDVLTGEILDFFGGQRDLRSRLLRRVDEKSFVEDPLRVLRAAQFAARFEFSVSADTVSLCREMDLTALSRERVEGEMKKALLQARCPSVFFETLRKMNGLSCWFPELEDLIGVRQDPEHHPEGDVWNHTMQVLDRAAALREKAKQPYAFMLLALTHDFGKAVTTEEINGRLHAYRHETEGVPLAESFLQRLTGEKKLLAYVRNMLPLHMRPNVAAQVRPKRKSTNRLFDEAAEPEDLVLLAFADKPQSEENEKFLLSRLSGYYELMALPQVMGKDLLAAGVTPGPEFSEALAYSHKLHLAGIPKEDALHQTLSYIRKAAGRDGSV